MQYRATALTSVPSDPAAPASAEMLHKEETAKLAFWPYALDWPSEHRGERGPLGSCDVHSFSVLFAGWHDPVQQFLRLASALQQRPLSDQRLERNQQPPAAGPHMFQSKHVMALE